MPSEKSPTIGYAVHCPYCNRRFRMYLEEAVFVQVRGDEGEDAYEPLISENNCSKCREGHGDGTCEWGFKSGYNEKGEIECQNFNPKAVD